MGFFETLAGAAAITGGANVAGGVIGNLVNQNFQENEATRNQSNFNITQDNFERNTQIRVADAKAAGIHPLYALGATVSGPSGSQPIVMNDQIGQSLQNAGQGVGNILARTDSADQKLMNQLEIELRRSQIDETDARTAALNSQAMRDMQAGQTGLGIQTEMTGSIAPEGQAPNAPGHSGEGMINKKAAEVTSQSQGRPDLIAGFSRAGFERRTMGKDSKGKEFIMIMPVAEGESPMELWSEMSWYDKAGLINRNMAEFGPQWFDTFMDVMYRGKSNKQSYLDYKLSPKINDWLYGDKAKVPERKGGRINPKTGRLIY